MFESKTILADMKTSLWVLFLAGTSVANASPVIELGTPENDCVVYCYIRVPFTIANYGSTHKIGRIFCDLDADVTAKLPVYNGEARTKDVQASSIGVYKVSAGYATGDVEMNTGITKAYFVGAKVKSARCHL